MHYTDSKIIEGIFKKYPDLIEIDTKEKYRNSIIVNNYIYLSCKTKTKGSLDYLVIYEPKYVDDDYQCKIKRKQVALHEDDYWSANNKGFFARYSDTPGFVVYCEEHGSEITHIGVGDSLVILDANTLEISNIYYFKDLWNMPCPIKILGVIDDRVIVYYSNFQYVFYKEWFDNYAFVGGDSGYNFGNIWIIPPYLGYEYYNEWTYIDFRTKKDSIIHALYSDEHPFRGFTNCHYDFRNSRFVFSNESVFSTKTYVSVSFGIDVLLEEDSSKLRYIHLGADNWLCVKTDDKEFLNDSSESDILHYTDSKIVEEIFKKYPDLIDVETHEKYRERNPHNKYEDSIIVNEYIYLSCYIQTENSLDYLVINEEYDDNNYYQCKIKRKQIALHDDTFRYYLETGPSLVILKANTLEILNIYYFNVLGGMPVNILGVIDNKVIVHSNRRHFVFKKELFDDNTFEGDNCGYSFGDIWIYPSYMGWDGSCQWNYFDFRTQKSSRIEALYNTQHSFPWINIIHYDFKQSSFVFSNKSFSDPETNVSVSFGIDVLLEEDSSKLEYIEKGENNWLCVHSDSVNDNLPQISSCDTVNGLHYIDSEAVEEIFRKHPDLIKLESTDEHQNSIIVNDYIYLYCNVKTETEEPYTGYKRKMHSRKWGPGYYALYEPTIDDGFLYYNIKHKKRRVKTSLFSDEERHISLFNYDKDAAKLTDICLGDSDTCLGNSLVIINTDTLAICNIYNFKGAWRLPFKFMGVAGDRVVVHYYGLNYVFNKGKFEQIFRGSRDNYYIFGDIWITAPSNFCNNDFDLPYWQFIDFKEKEFGQIWALDCDEHPSFKMVTNCHYDYRNSRFIFSSENETISFDYEVLIRSFLEHARYKLKYIDLGENNWLCIKTNHLRNFPFTLSSWDTVKGIPYYFFWYYFPKRFTDVSSESERGRKIIWGFKDGIKTNPSVANLVIDLLRKTFSKKKLKRFTFVCIPASSKEKNEKRYKSFSATVCGELGMRDAFPKITITKEKMPAHLSPNHITEPAEYAFDGDFFRGETIILFDDVVTTGNSMAEFKSILENKYDAQVLCAITIGRTYSDFHGDNRKPHPYTGTL